MSPGYQATQALHAAVELAMYSPRRMKPWNGTVVSLGCEDEFALFELMEKFEGNCHWTIFYEPDIKSYTSIAALLDENQAKRLSYLPLLLSGRR